MTRLHKLLTVCLIIVGILMVTGWLMVANKVRRSSPQNAPPYVAASIYPLYDIVRNVAGPDKSVVLIVPPGSDPTAYQPTAADRQKLAGVKYIFTAGHGVDDWVGAIKPGSDTPATVVLDGNVELLPAVIATTSSTIVMDPYYWISIKNAKKMVQTVLATLSKDDPKAAPQFQSRADAYLQQLEDVYRYGQQLRQQSGFQSLKVTGRGAAYIAGDVGLPTVLDNAAVSGIVEPFGGSIDKDTYLGMMKANLETVFK